jgi:hypothetical protein
MTLTRAAASLVLLCSSLIAGCAPMQNPETDGGDASRPRPDAIEPYFDGTAREASAPMDGPAPTTCADWCTQRLSECGDPLPLARELCEARCARASMPAAAIDCLRAALCVDVRTAFSREAPICGLDPVLDAGVSRPDSALDAALDARADSGAIVDTGVRVDTGGTDTGVRVDSGVMDTGVRVDSGVMDSGVVTDTGVRTDSATDAPRG